MVQDSGWHSCHLVALLRKQEEGSQNSEPAFPGSPRTLPRPPQWTDLKQAPHGAARRLGERFSPLAMCPWEPGCCCSAGRGGRCWGGSHCHNGPAWDTSSSRLCCSRRPQLAVLCRAHESTTSTALPLTGQVRAGIQPTAPNLQVRFTPEKSYPKSALCKTLPKLSSSRTSLTRRLAHRLVPAGSGWAPASPSRTIL